MNELLHYHAEKPMSGNGNGYGYEGYECELTKTAIAQFLENLNKQEKLNINGLPLTIETEGESFVTIHCREYTQGRAIAIAHEGYLESATRLGMGLRIKAPPDPDWDMKNAPTAFQVTVGRSSVEAEKAIVS